MDPLSIAANVVGIAVVCGKLSQSVGQFVIDTKGAPDIVSEFYETIRNLHSALSQVGQVLQSRPRQLPFEKEHHRKIGQIAKSCKKALDKLDGQLPSLRDKPTSIDKVRMNLSMSLKSNSIKQTIIHINSYTQVLQLSLVTLSLGSLWGTQSSQDQIQAEIRSLTDKIRSSNLLLQRPDLPPPGQLTEMDDHVADANMAVTRDIQAWRATADDVAAAVSLHNPDQMSLDARSEIHNLASDSGVDISPEIEEDDFDPEPGYADCPSREILQYQFEHNQMMVSQLVKCGIFLKASSYQRKGIEWRKQLAEVHNVALTPDESADMKEFLAEILMNTDIPDLIIEGKEMLRMLLKEEVTKPTEQIDEHRRCRLYHKLGKLYMEQGRLEQARRDLSRAFEGRRRIDPMPKDLVRESAELLVKALQLDQAFDEARGYMEYIGRELNPEPASIDPTIPPSVDNELSSAFAWCQERGFDVDSEDFCFEVCDSMRGTSPLHLVIQEENLEMFRLVIDHVVSLEHRDSDFATPLLLACSTRNRETVGMLLQRKAKVDVRDLKGMSPLHRCQSTKGGVQVAKLVVEYAPCPPPASVSAVPEIINQTDNSGKAALIMACEKENVEMATFLMEQGAKPDLTEKYGKTALYMACQRGDERIVKCLLENRAGPNVQGPGQCTPLVAVIEAAISITAKLSIIEMLLAHGADPRVADADGQNAFVAAKKAGFGSEITRRLQRVDPRRLSTTSAATASSRAPSNAESFRSQAESVTSQSSGRVSDNNSGRIRLRWKKDEGRGG
ncbi:putative ankyrin-2 isoform 2 protein [Phaeoacremonium minimum UCRPA7]|uniref:Putative ankyrin-2 isoform 2 protein n=1 Tax=Phaeoacremonium minimum (strain UCR-PA7) TaxID=1286976 RepID=R8BHE1_PHAM7|nr:putative ankyrin-2 isoform 2 protein [Phaeoacremonium minimum UCRPA7]EON98721.1 putative ankyrin-2 isoform 2 protein [Phaeoacremonium minimum UCRPA7]